MSILERWSCHPIYNVPRLKSLPYWRPPAYCLTLGLNTRGGGKSETGKVCDPTLGGGEGTTSTMR